MINRPLSIRVRASLKLDSQMSRLSTNDECCVDLFELLGIPASWLTTMAEW